MTEATARLRERFRAAPLSKDDVDRDPFKQFDSWFEQAVRAEVYEPTAMTLATATADGAPSARVVLLKQADERGFAFYTSYDSPKAGELVVNPRAALVFWWQELGRQVRIDGRVEKVLAEESDHYFRSRPRGSQLSAVASPQGRVIESRTELELLVAEQAARHQGKDVPRPDHWGGYRVAPTCLEFWQHRDDRLHDRIRYRLTDDAGWVIERLAP